MVDATPRLALPLLAAGQAQKEIFHNEALVLLDGLVQPVAETMGEAAPPPAPEPGQCFLVGASPSGAWAGQAEALAIHGAGGWRFAAPREGMMVWVAENRGWARYFDGAWSLAPDIAEPAGGAVVDSEARTAIDAILTVLRGHGFLIA